MLLDWFQKKKYWLVSLLKDKNKVYGLRFTVYGSRSGRRDFYRIEKRVEEIILVWMGEGYWFEVRGSKFEVSRCGRRDGDDAV
jgi:hypothetical protein